MASERRPSPRGEELSSFSRRLEMSHSLFLSASLV